MKKRVFVGFDGYIDQILYPILSASSDCNHEYFKTIDDFGTYLKGKSGKSCNIQLKQVSEQLGGNGPIFARTLKSLGCNIKIAGMFGKESVHPLFSEVFEEDEILSYLNPMHSDALEFTDGKIMMCPMAPMTESPLNLLEKASESTSFNIKEALKSDLCAYLNWGEIGFIQKLWEEIFEKYFKNTDINKSKMIFFDPADISQRSSEDVYSMLDLIKSYSFYRYTILSLNENEAIQIGIKIYNTDNIVNVLNNLQKDFNIDELVIHSNYKTISSVQGNLFTLPTDHVEKPLISTGAGDNFNAGFCYGKLNDMNPEDCIRMAHKTSAFYITHARPLKKEEL